MLLWLMTFLFHHKSRGNQDKMQSWKASLFYVQECIMIDVIKGDKLVLIAIALQACIEESV